GPVSKPSDTLYNVTFGVGVYVFVGANGTVGRATDPHLWATARQALPTLQDIVFANNEFVIVAFFGSIFTSPDAITFTTQLSSTQNDLRAVAFGNGRWVAVGVDGIVRSSADAVTWK